MTYTIWGAGLAGLLAGGMLRDECSEIVEAQGELPNNHNALLRFRSSIVGDTLNIPFKPVEVLKAIHSPTNPVRDAIMYSIKTTGSARLRSILSASPQTETRYIAPPDLVKRMAEKVTAEFRFGQQATLICDKHKGPIISTLPMKTLMGILGYDEAHRGVKRIEPIDFKYIRGEVVTATIPGADIYATLYFPDGMHQFYRASITGDQLIVEYAWLNDMILLGSPEGNASVAASLFGFNMEVTSLENVKHKHQTYAKILPIDDDVRKRFIQWATDKFGIYSLGRFATWRPGLLLDDLVNDVRVIQKIVTRGSYDHRK